MIAISGKFDISLDNGKEKQTFHLNSPSQGLYIPAGTWRELTSFADHTVCVVLASDYYDENDYFRNYTDFMNFINDQASINCV